MDVSVVIPTWNGKELLKAYLPSVFEACAAYAKETGRKTEILLVDDASTDGTTEWLASSFAGRLQLVRHEHNLGFSDACNTGFRAARHPIVLLLNNDVRLAPDCIAPLTGHFADRALFAATGKLLNQKGSVFCNGGKIARFRRGMWSTFENYDAASNTQPELSLLSFTAIGAFSAFDRSKVLEIGGFDTLAVFLEDVEISYRGWKRGWVIRYDPRSVAYHDASQTMDSRYRRRRLDMLSRRSRILIHWMLLHDSAMFRRHLLSLAGRFLVSWLALDYRFYWELFSGLALLPRVLEKRRETRRTMARTDRELYELLQEFYRTAPILRADPEK